MHTLLPVSRSEGPECIPPLRAPDPPFAGGRTEGQPEAEPSSAGARPRRHAERPSMRASPPHRLQPLPGGTPPGRRLRCGPALTHFRPCRDPGSSSSPRARRQPSAGPQPQPGPHPDWRTDPLASVQRTGGLGVSPDRPGVHRPEHGFLLRFHLRGDGRYAGDTCRGFPAGPC